MEVKIYRELENESLIIDENHLKEYNAIATELGLQSLERQETNKTPNIYVCLNIAMQKQLQAICPKIQETENYTRTTIPLEVLKVYKYAKDNQMFDGFQIWYNDIEPDPMLIGWKWMDEEAKKKNYSWKKNRFLIARWGDCAMEMPELLQLGFNTIKTQLLDSAKESMSKCKLFIDNPEIYVRKILSENNSDLNISIETSANKTIY
jgi:hypothetical protein